MPQRQPQQGMIVQGIMQKPMVELILLTGYREPARRTYERACTVPKCRRITKWGHPDESLMHIQVYALTHEGLCEVPALCAMPLRLKPECQQTVDCRFHVLRWYQKI